MALQFIQSGPHLLKDCIAKALEYHFLTSNPSSHMPRARVRGFWSKPPSGWFKLNTDASITDHKVGGGSLIRDSEGQWVQGFTRHIGSASALMAELWALQMASIWQRIFISTILLSMWILLKLLSSSLPHPTLIGKPNFWSMIAGTLSKFSIRSSSITTTGKPIEQLIPLQKLDVLRRSVLFPL